MLFQPTPRFNQPRSPLMQKGVARFSNNLKRKKEGHLERKTLGLELLQDGRE